MPKQEGKHRIAQVLPIGTEVPPQLVREYIGDAVSAKTLKRLTDKILGRPPVKFIYSVVCDILTTTKSNNDLLERLESRGIANKEDRIACVKLMSDAMQEAGGYSSAIIIPSKVCAGKQVDRTRLLLVVFGHVALGMEGDEEGAASAAKDDEQGGLEAADTEAATNRTTPHNSGGIVDEILTAEAGGDAEVTIQLEPKLSNPDMQDEILKEWDKIAKRDSQADEEDNALQNMVKSTRELEQTAWSQEDREKQVGYMSLIKDAARSAYQISETALASHEGKEYLTTEALVFQEIENKNLYITELERLDPADKLGAKFALSATIQFWGFTTRQFVSIKSINEPTDELKCNVPVIEAELEPGDIILRVDDTLINSGADFAAACAGKTYMQVAYIRPLSPVPDARFMRKARLAIENKVRRSALNVVQAGLKWINTLTGKKKKFNVLDVIIRLQRKYRRQHVAGAAAAAKPADVAAASSRRASRRRRRSKAMMEKRVAEEV